MKQPLVFVILIDELRKGGKIKTSPISREANSFDCPKCGNLISPDNPKLATLSLAMKNIKVL